MPESNLRQADVPEGGEALPNPLGTAPGLRCPVGDGVVYAVPGVPYEMRAMVADLVLPDLLSRSGEASALVSRSLKTWGTSEAALAEMVGERVDVLDVVGNPTIAFLARGIEGLVVRITAKAPSAAEARAMVAKEEAEVLALLGDLVFAVDDETMETAVVARLAERGWTLGVAESVTGGLVGARLVNVPGASDVFRGTIGSYATDVKRRVLGVTAESVVSEEAAAQMAEGAQRVLGADVGIAITGVAGTVGAGRPARGDDLSRHGASRSTDGVAGGTPARRPGAHQAVRDDLVAEPAATPPRRPARRRRRRCAGPLIKGATTMANMLTPNLDVADLDLMSAFWCAAIDYEPSAGAGQYRVLRPRSGEGPRLILQQVPEPKVTKNRLHLDLDNDASFDIGAEATRLEGLGATRLSGEMTEWGSRWIVMADPEGNEFCVCAQ